MNNGVRFTKEYVIDYLRDNGCELKSIIYKNTKTPISILFECGHTREMSLDAFRQGQRCSCNKQERFKSTIEYKTRNKILKVLSDKNFELISFEDNVASWDGEITYKCNYNHIVKQGIREFLRNNYCKKCTNIKRSIDNLGNKGSNWKGGITIFRDFIRKYTLQWRKDSAKNCNYKCVITNQRFDEIHHLYPLNKIIYDALFELGLDKYEFVGDYSEDDLLPIIYKVQEIHERYPLGVCLRKDIHILFHQIFSEDCTPEDFYEFQDKINSGEIQINY